jgi:neurotransmitter:Na+ symporter, NSS family
MSASQATPGLPRAQWKSTAGFILATLGAAIGLGNIWRFSYVTGENGGGAFLVVYLGAVLVVGLPVLLGEIAIGRSTRREAASAFAHLARHGLWRHVGVLGVAASFAILTYYAVISGWALKYFAGFASLAYPLPQGDALKAFESFTAGTFEPSLWHAAILAVAVAIVVGGVEQGIERACKVLMPLLAIIVVLLALHSLTLPNASAGLRYLFAPDWSVLERPQVYLAALGQAFFSLGLAMGVLVTYGSYLPSTIRLPSAAVAVAFGDSLFAIVASIVIFPAVFSFGMSPAQGPGLAFVVLPEIFARMPGGTLIGAAFFGLLVVAALTSLMALLEVCVAYLVERWEIARSHAIAWVTGVGFALGVPSSLGFGLWSDVRIAGMPILDAVDFAASNVLLPLSGLAIALFLGWHWLKDDALDAVGLRSPALIAIWRLAVRYVAPAMIVIVVLRSMGAI